MSSTTDQLGPTWVQGLIFFKDEDVHLKELLARWVMALPVVTMVHLRAGMDLKAELQVCWLPMLTFHHNRHEGSACLTCRPHHALPTVAPPLVCSTFCCRRS